MENKPSLSSLIGATTVDLCIFMDDALYSGAIPQNRIHEAFADLTFDKQPAPLDQNDERLKRLCDLTNVLNVLCRVHRSSTFTDPPIYDQATVDDLLKATRMIDAMLISVEPILRRRIEILNEDRSRLETL